LVETNLFRADNVLHATAGLGDRIGVAGPVVPGSVQRRRPQWWDMRYHRFRYQNITKPCGKDGRRRKWDVKGGVEGLTRLVGVRQTLVVARCVPIDGLGLEKGGDLKGNNEAPKDASQLDQILPDIIPSEKKKRVG